MAFKSKISCFLTIIILLAHPSYSKTTSNLSLGTGISTMGFTASSIINFHPQFGLEIGGSKFHLTINDKILADTSYNVNIDLESIHLLSNFHPFNKKFKITIGVLYNKNCAYLDGKYTGANIIVNGITIPANHIGSLSGKIYFNPISPYVGIGWGPYYESKVGFNFAIDFGILYHGKPKITLSGSNVTTAAVAAAITDEIQDLTHEFDKFVIYPILSLKLFYTFI